MASLPPPAWMVRLNVALLRSGAKIGSQYVLSVVGRRTGRLRTTPVSIVRVGPERYIVSAFPHAAWVINVRAAGAGTLGRGGQVEEVRMRELPPGERGPVLRAFFQQVRGGRRFFGGQSADQVVADAGTYPVFRVESA